MADTSVSTRIEGGAIQGVVGAGQVVIHNLYLGASAPPAQTPEAVADGAISACPYPGLAYFGPQDSSLFFGREKAIAALEAAVTQHALTALVGGSGTGKSSVVLAGLAPRLHAQGGWRFSHFRISTESNNDPFMALARALVPLFDDQGAVDRLETVQRLAANLESGAVRVSNALDGCRAKNPGKRILLIADQFEELFTLVNDAERCQRFQDVLLAGFAAASNRPRDIALVLTLRGDFYGAALRHRALSDALQDHVENLAPMTREELRDAIVKPAGAIRFEAGLVDTLLDAVEDRRGSLPLLQFALREMWERMEQRCITRASYDAIGGVKGALAQRAQAIFDDLTQNGKDLAQVQLFRRLFTRLVNLGDVVDTRRVVDREELGHDAWELAQRLAGESNRLVVISAERNRETAEVVHEALIHGWPTLDSWIASDRRLQLWLRQLQPQLEAWRKNPEDDGTLLRGGPLAGAEVWLAQRGDDFSAEERSYVAASVALREKTRHRDAKVQRVIRRFVQAAGGAIAIAISLSGFHLWIKSNNEAATWTMGWSALYTRTWLLFHEPPESEMVMIAKGQFIMGSPEGDGDEDEHPLHAVAVNAFEMGRFEVTFEEYDVFASATLRERPSDRGWGRQRRPVINVSWHDAIAYAKWLNQATGKNYRLPSEAEWEFAARAGTDTTYWWGNEISKSGDRPHCNGCGSEQDGDKTVAVASFDPNPWGLYDTAGNVWEWTADCWHDSYKNAPRDGSAWTSADGGNCNSRVVRGGSWTGSARDRRSAERLQNGANSAASDQGFRLARDAPR